MKVKIKRLGKEGPYFQTYDLEVDGTPTVLEILSKIKEDQDPTLAFRAMCRSSICGTCGVKMNGRAVLACKERVKEEEIVLEPLEGFPVLRDLVTDHEGIPRRLKTFRIWLDPREGEVTVLPQDLRATERSSDCILCGICDSVCPPLLEGSTFAGPMAITRFYRISSDKRDALGDKRIEACGSSAFMGCVHCSNCTLLCPKSCMPERWVTVTEGKLAGMGYIQRSGQDFDFLSF